MATRRLDEGVMWLDRVLALGGGDDGRRGRSLFEAGYLAFWKGNDERSTSLQNRAVEIGRRTNDPTVTALALVGLARLALRTNVDEARSYAVKPSPRRKARRIGKAARAQCTCWPLRRKWQVTLSRPAS
jgi:hypothetical protein